MSTGIKNLLLTLSKKNKISLPETELITAIRNKEKIGSEALYDMYSPALYGIIFRTLQDEEQSKDLLQDAYIKIWNSFASYDESKGRLFTWMVNIVRNLVIDRLRSKDFRNSNKNQDIDNSVNAIDEQLNTSINPDTVGVKDMLKSLKPESKMVLDLVYFRGYTHVEAAEELGLPLGTVKTRIRIAINTLRKIFN